MRIFRAIAIRGLPLAMLAAGACEAPFQESAGSGWHLPPVEHCTLGFEDPCFEYRLVREADIRAIKADDGAIASIFPRYVDRLRTVLRADDPLSPFHGIDESGLALAFSTAVAYEAMPYRGFGSAWSQPVSRDASDLLADGAGLVCDEYVALTIQLFYRIEPQAADSQVLLHSVGWRSTSPLQNHAQLFASGTGIPMLADPTYGWVARATLDGLLQGSVAAFPDGPLAMRNGDSDAQSWLAFTLSTNSFDTDRGRMAVEESPGLYAPSPVIYDFVARDAGQGGLRATYGPGDFTARFAPGPGGTFWLLDTDGDLWELTATGPRLYDPVRRFSGLAARSADGIVEALTATGDVLEIGPGTEQVIASGVDSIAEGLQGHSVYLRGTDGTLLADSASGVSVVEPAVAAVAEGEGGIAAYCLTTAGTLERIDVGGPQWAAGGIAKIAAGRGAQAEGRSVFVKGLDGSLSRIDAHGQWIRLAGTGTALDRPVRDFLLGLGGNRVKVLTTDGLVREGTIDAASGKVLAWSEPAWIEGPATAPFDSFELGDLDQTLVGTQVDGATRTAPGSSF